MSEVPNMDIAAGAENWDQDLADILNIVGADGCDNSASSPVHSTEDTNEAIEDDLGRNWWFYPGQEIVDSQPSQNTNSGCDGLKELPSQQALMFQSTYPSLNPKIKSNGTVFPLDNYMAIGHNSLDDGACIVRNSTIKDNNRHLKQKPNARSCSYGMDCAVLDIEASLSGVNHSMENKGRDKLETCSFMKKKKPKIPQKSSGRLFGILSLIFRAFTDPLTSELEERYFQVLQKALLEIENTRHNLSEQSHAQQI